MLLGHGGNIGKSAHSYNLKEGGIIDFSSNINPLGISSRIKRAIKQGINALSNYPDPESLAAREALSSWLGVGKNNILVGNGSNEFIHLLPRALGCISALIYKPAFSEYEESIRLSKAKPKFLFAREEEGFLADVRKIRDYAGKVSLIILCNPNNPTGNLMKAEELLVLAESCARNKTYLLVDEVFMDFVQDQKKYSLVKAVKSNEYLLILRSLTKFFSLPGLRAGYLLAGPSTIKKIEAYLPTWSVNSFAQSIIQECLGDKEFIAKTKEYIRKEREFLYARLREIRGISAYPPAANFIFCKILDKRINSGALFTRLIKSGILIRDCGNFQGLSNRFFRVAVRKRRDNLHLVNRLELIFQ